MRGLGYPLYVNGKLFDEPVTISHVPGAPIFSGGLPTLNGRPPVAAVVRYKATGAVDPSMGALGAYAAYQYLGAADLPAGADPRSLPPPPAPPVPEHSSVVSPVLKYWGYVAPVSALACAYHGYKRNHSILWALVWGLFGSMPITPVIAIAQGFGKPKAGLTPNRSRRRQRNTSRTSLRAQIRDAGRVAKERGDNSVDSFNQAYEFKLGAWARGAGYSKDEAWKIYKAAFDSASIMRGPSSGRRRNRRSRR